MLAVLHRPLRADGVALVSAGLILASAAYCLAYNMLAGRDETLANAAAWALINIVPWYFAFEAGKRVSVPYWPFALAAGLLLSLVLHLLVSGVPGAPAFELIRRLPGLICVLALLGVHSILANRKARSNIFAEELPLAPGQIDWISAAGNYVELRAAGRTILHRAPLVSVEARLKRHGFVRIHRSILVRREKIARVRSNDVVLHDGTSLKTGKRYRSTIIPH